MKSMKYSHVVQTTDMCQTQHLAGLWPLINPNKYDLILSLTTFPMWPECLSNSCPELPQKTSLTNYCVFNLHVFFFPHSNASSM